MPCFDRKLEASRLDFFHKRMGNKDQLATQQDDDDDDDDFAEVKDF